VAPVMVHGTSDALAAPNENNDKDTTAKTFFIAFPPKSLLLICQFEVARHSIEAEPNQQEQFEAYNTHLRNARISTDFFLPISTPPLSDF
jgi:hypothetical protein